MSDGWYSVRRLPNMLQMVDLWRVRRKGKKCAPHRAPNAYLCMAGKKWCLVRHAVDEYALPSDFTHWRPVPDPPRKVRAKRLTAGQPAGGNPQD